MRQQLLSPALQCARRALTSTVAKVAVALAVAALPSLAFAEAFDTAGIDEAITASFTTYLTLAIQVISVIVFLMVGWGVLTKFISALQGRSEWGEVFMPVAIGVIVIGICTFLFAQATELVGGIGGA